MAVTLLWTVVQNHTTRYATDSIIPINIFRTKQLESATGWNTALLSAFFRMNLMNRNVIIKQLTLLSEQEIKKTMEKLQATMSAMWFKS